METFRNIVVTAIILFGILSFSCSLPEQHDEYGSVVIYLGNGSARANVVSNDGNETYLAPHLQYQFICVGNNTEYRSNIAKAGGELRNDNLPANQTYTIIIEVFNDVGNKIGDSRNQSDKPTVTIKPGETEIVTAPIDIDFINGKNDTSINEWVFKNDPFYGKAKAITSPIKNIELAIREIDGQDYEAYVRLQLPNYKLDHNGLYHEYDNSLNEFVIYAVDGTSSNYSYTFYDIKKLEKSPGTTTGSKFYYIHGSELLTDWADLFLNRSAFRIYWDNPSVEVSIRYDCYEEDENKFLVKPSAVKIDGESGYPYLEVNNFTYYAYVVANQESGYNIWYEIVSLPIVDLQPHPGTTGTASADPSWFKMPTGLNLDEKILRICWDNPDIVVGLKTGPNASYDFGPYKGLDSGQGYYYQTVPTGGVFGSLLLHLLYVEVTAENSASFSIWYDVVTIPELGDDSNKNSGTVVAGTDTYYKIPSAMYNASSLVRVCWDNANLKVGIDNYEMSGDYYKSPAIGMQGDGCYYLNLTALDLLVLSINTLLGGSYVTVTADTAQSYQIWYEIVVIPELGDISNKTSGSVGADAFIYYDLPSEAYEADSVRICWNNANLKVGIDSSDMSGNYYSTPALGTQGEGYYYTTLSEWTLFVMAFSSYYITVTADDAQSFQIWWEEGPANNYGWGSGWPSDEILAEMGLSGLTMPAGATNAEYYFTEYSGKLDLEIEFDCNLSTATTFASNFRNANYTEYYYSTIGGEIDGYWIRNSDGALVSLSYYDGWLWFNIYEL